MRKSIIFGFVLSVVCMALFACDDKKDTGPSDEQSYLRLSDGSKVPLNVHYIRTQYFGYPPSARITIVSSANELEQYYEENRMRIYDGYGNLMADESFWGVIEQYFNNYFADNSLLIVGLTENSGSNRHKVERIDENGDIVIKRLLPEIGTDDMAAWCIVIELKNSYKKEQYRAVIL